MFDLNLKKMFGKQPESTDNNDLINVVSAQAAQSLYENKQEINLSVVNSHVISIAEVGQEFTLEQKQFILKKLVLDDLESDADLPFTATFMIEQIQSLKVEEAIQIMKDTLVEHDGDINFSDVVEEKFKRLIAVAESSSTQTEKLSQAFVDAKDTPEPEEKTLSEVTYSTANKDKPDYEEYLSREAIDEASFDWEFVARVEAGLVAFWSPYPEVRAVTTPYDDPNEPCETFRAYCISIIWQGIGTFINTYFAARQPPILFTSQIGQVFIYPCGLAWATVIPNWTIPFPFGYLIRLNPGPWTQKEQMYASLIYFVAGLQNGIYNIIYSQKAKILLYSPWADWGYEILLGLSSSYMGFGIAGLLRSMYVYPVKAMWPTMLPTVAVNTALMAPEKKENINGWKLSQYSFFFIIFFASFLYFWVPDYLFTGLSTFSWMSWIRPDNLYLDAVTGFNGGVGLNPFPTFDFNNIFYIQALAQPIYTTLLQYSGTWISLFGIIGMWFSNYKWTGYLPINSQLLFDNTGNVYNVTRVVDSEIHFVKSAYETYSPPFYSAGLLMKYGASFAIVPMTVMYVSGVYYKQLWQGFKVIKKVLFSRKGSSFSNFNDPFCRMNSAYKEAPEWWFLVVLVISIVLAIVCVEIYPTGTPVWTIFFALAFNVVFLVPFMQVYSTTGAYVSLTTVIELIIGYSVRGNGVSVMLGSLYGYAIDEQAQNYITNQKLAHYTKIPPQAMFRGQLLTTFINIVITIAIVNWQVTFPDICTPEQKNKFTCPSARNTYNTAISWGVIGPYRVVGQLYPMLKWSFLIGFVIAIPFVLIKWYAPKRYTKYLQPIVITYGMTLWAPYNMSYITGGVYIALAFMWYIKSRYLAWWIKYNYIFYAAILAGIAFSSVIIFFAVMYHEKDLVWWGNDVVDRGYEGNPMGHLDPAAAPDGYFGPRIGTFD